MSDNWTRTTDRLPPHGIIVKTKVHDEHGERNNQSLKLKGRLWFHADDSMYVYYEPSHWAY